MSGLLFLLGICFCFFFFYAHHTEVSEMYPYIHEYIEADIIIYLTKQTSSRNNEKLFNVYSVRTQKRNAWKQQTIKLTRRRHSLRKKNGRIILLCHHGAVTMERKRCGTITIVKLNASVITFSFFSNKMFFFRCTIYNIHECITCDGARAYNNRCICASKNERSQIFK